MNILLITWSFEDQYLINDSFIYKSLNKLNLTDRLIHIHYNRNHYKELEQDFEKKFGYQYEFILYKIFLIPKMVSNINFDNFIYCDTNDVVCVKHIDNIDNYEKIIFSSEIHKYPSNFFGWQPINEYTNDDLSDKNFLNSGLFFSNKKNYLLLIEQLINTVLPLGYKNFGGDQGVFTYHYINNLYPKIYLDSDCNFFLSTYLRNPDDYEITPKKSLINKHKKNEPFFIHDNGWNYGSPKFIKNFNLI